MQSYLKVSSQFLLFFFFPNCSTGTELTFRNIWHILIQNFAALWNDSCKRLKLTLKSMCFDYSKKQQAVSQSVSKSVDLPVG